MTPEEVAKLSVLARIATTEEEQKSLAHDIERILGYVTELSAVETTTLAHGELRNVMRADEVSHEASAHTETLLAAAPRREGQYVAVKKIL